MIASTDRYSLAELRPDTVEVRLVATSRGPGLLEWFVSPRAKQGASLYEIELAPKWKADLDALVAQGLVPPYPAYDGPPPPPR